MNIILLIISFSLAGLNGINEQIKNDISLIVPGLGAEGVLLYENAKKPLGLKGYPDKVSEFEDKKELFRDVFKVKSPVGIYFNKIYYYSYHKAIFFIDSDKISAIAGMNTDRITPESVKLGKGVEYFIFNYGNKNLETLKKENANDIIYLYFKYGIAIIDDKNDDRIDIYLVFPRQNE